MRVREFVLMGIHTPELDTIELTPREIATLTKAAAILREYRERLERLEEGDDGEATDITLAAYTIDDLVGP